MPGTHTASKCVSTCNLVIKKKRSQKKPLRARNTHRKQGVAEWTLVTKKSGSVKNRYLPGTRLELAHP